MSRAPVVLFAFVLAACDGGDARRTPHAAVDPALDLAILVPPNMKRVEVGVAWINRAEVFGDAAAWAADERAHNVSYTVSEPTPDGDGWVLSLTREPSGFPDVRSWYRPLGDGLAITCTAVTGSRAATAEEHELTRKVCAGTQRLPQGIYVPFEFSRTEKSTDVVLALVDEPLNWRVQLERVADSPEWRFRPEGVGGDQRQLDRGSLADGSWLISGGETQAVGMHYDVVARRTIGALALACYGDNYHDDAYTRRQLALCLALEKP